MSGKKIICSVHFDNKCEKKSDIGNLHEKRTEITGKLQKSSKRTMVTENTLCFIDYKNNRFTLG